MALLGENTDASAGDQQRIDVHRIRRFLIAEQAALEPRSRPTGLGRHVDRNAHAAFGVGLVVVAWSGQILEGHRTDHERIADFRQWIDACLRQRAATQRIRIRPDVDRGGRSTTNGTCQECSGETGKASCSW